MSIKTRLFFMIILGGVLLCGAIGVFNFLVKQNTPTPPTLYKGRFRPIDTYARLWLNDFYNHHTFRKIHWASFYSHNGSALNFVWKIHFFGSTYWNDAPLFYISSSDLKDLLKLDATQNYFSYRQLLQPFNHDPLASFNFLRPLILYHAAKQMHQSLHRPFRQMYELDLLAPGLFVKWEKEDIILAAIPQGFPWRLLNAGDILLKNDKNVLYSIERDYKALAEQSLNLLSQMQLYSLLGQKGEDSQQLTEAVEQLQRQQMPPEEIAQVLENRFPLHQRLRQAGNLFKVLPGRTEGEWYSLDALKIKIFDSLQQSIALVKNFTPYSDQQFERIRQIYLQLEKKAVLNQGDKSELYALDETLLAQLELELNRAYLQLAQRPYRQANGKSLTYPSFLQLFLEEIYYRYPFVELALTAYLISGMAFILYYTLSQRIWLKGGYLLFGIAFITHSFILIMRSLILQRPPVSNMFETVVYVPWVTAIVGIGSLIATRTPLPLLASACVASILMSLLQTTSLQEGLENVQAVLDSQYWLMIHVLMVVGSYGAFCLAGILGHFYFVLFFWKNNPNSLRLIGKLILMSIYLGITLLIPGTILGGVWAAESWGRFWDWDPKESWAFISICVYLIVIHLHRYQKIDIFGLAVGSLIGLMAISFTWYGVNYILGTGFHSYGFGAGGEIFYYLYLFVECLLIGVVFLRKEKLAVKPL